MSTPTPCPLCGAQSRILQSYEAHVLACCGRCDFAFVTPPMSPEAHREWHDRDFFLRYYGEDIERFYARQGSLYQREREKKSWMLDQVARRVPRGRLLDVGTGQGLFSYLARDRGYEVHATEVCPMDVSYHRAQGLAVFDGYLEEAGYPDDGFDVVTMWHTLEHVLDPLRTLREVHRILKPGGYLVGALPNWRGAGTQLRLRLGRALFDPRTNHELHFAHYSRKALMEAFDRAGLLFVECGREWHRPRRMRDRLVSWVGGALSRLPGVNARETMTFVARKPASTHGSGRAFVRYRNDQPSLREPSMTRTEGRDVAGLPAISIVIPTADGQRGGYLPALLAQLETQSRQDFEVLVVQGDVRQGRAINRAVDEARGEYIVTFDDDSRLGHDHVLDDLVAVLAADPGIGMVGGVNTIPADAPPFVRRIMAELPRRQTPPVTAVTDSDMAEHPCLAMRRAVFVEVGGENELIPRGLDPYLREAVRKAGLRVVVAPGIVYHHLPPADWPTLVRQFYRNGSQSCFCSQRYPQWVYETAEGHGGFSPRRPLPVRVARAASHLAGALARGHLVYASCRAAYALGWLREMVRQWWSRRNEP